MTKADLQALVKQLSDGIDSLKDDSVPSTDPLQAQLDQAQADLTAEKAISAQLQKDLDAVNAKMAQVVVDETALKADEAKLAADLAQ